MVTSMSSNSEEESPNPNGNAGTVPLRVAPAIMPITTVITLTAAFGLPV